MNETIGIIGAGFVGQALLKLFGETHMTGRNCVVHALAEIDRDVGLGDAAGSAQGGCRGDDRVDQAAGSVRDARHVPAGPAFSTSGWPRIGDLTQGRAEVPRGRDCRSWWRGRP